MDSRQMRTNIRNFSFDNCTYGNQGYNRLLVQLFGFMGHGKSSFINSCKYVVDDAEYEIYAPVARGEEGSKTMKRDTYQLTDTITLVDNRGCAKMDKTETGEIYLQLGNFQPLDQYVTWDEGYDNMLTQLLEADREDRSADFIAPVFVYSAQKSITSDEYDDIKEILTKAKYITSIVPAVVVTHEASGNLPDIQEKFRNMGVQLIFPLENYTQENPLKIRMKHEKILKCLSEIIKDVEFRMEESRNPSEEKSERKKILHTFLIEREKEKAREEIKKHTARAAIQQKGERQEDAQAAFQTESWSQEEAHAAIQWESWSQEEAHVAIQLVSWSQQEAHVAIPLESWSQDEAQAAFQTDNEDSTGCCTLL